MPTRHYLRLRLKSPREGEREHPARSRLHLADDIQPLARGATFFKTGFLKHALIFLLLLVAMGQQLHARIRVQMHIPRRLYVVYEPLLVTVAITNLSGHDVTLNDDGSQKWFSFQVNTGDGRIVPPTDLDYHLQPLTIPAGETNNGLISISLIHLCSTTSRLSRTRIFSRAAMSTAARPRTPWRAL